MFFLYVLALLVKVAYFYLIALFLVEIFAGKKRTKMMAVFLAGAMALLAVEYLFLNPDPHIQIINGCEIEGGEG